MIQKTMNEMSSIPIISDEEILTEDEIEEYLDNLKSKLPSFVIILLKNNLRGKRVTKSQLDKIVERITEVLSKRKEDKTEELNKKLQSLEQKLDTIMKLATMTASTKLSEELKPETAEKTEEAVEEETESTKVEEEKEEVKKEVKEPEEIEKVVEEEVLEIKEIPEEPIEEGSSMEPIEEEKQYILNDIPEDAVSMTLIFKWLEFLIGKVGIKNLPDVLDYYNKIGWISDKVILKLLKFTKNMRIVFDTEEVRPKDKLSPSDHIMSLMYIEKLAGNPINPETLEMLEIEIRRIKKWAEELQSI
ncbi:FlaD/FlaE family flagellar protein [Methanocaldococcus fervens]|uniref:Flagella protein n=1 Tax=Methanocaldococcus fervens (strain DSM 4213 / JCM 15782 / AG86) TaxID=573064 RepID=C7P8Y8_METFA|nr:FlaD/FlaE family flagellar protein [Methanocaldococcus fervens]ACV25020.1 flagella protein [Methanocaldococcus fervens AG86]